MTLLAASLRLLRPEALGLIALVPLFAWLALRGRRARVGEMAAIVARGLLLTLVAVALALPRIESDAKYRSVAYVLDVSDSIPKEALDEAKDFVRRSAAQRGEEDDASFLVFADRAAVEAPMSRLSATNRGEPVAIDPRAIATNVPSGETDIAGALGLARAGFAPGGGRGIVLLTDGNETRGDALAAVREFAAEKTEVTVVPLRYSRPNEVWVSKVVAPPVSPERAPARVRIVVESTHDVPGRLRILVDGSEVRAEDVRLRTGRNAYEIDVPFSDPGFHRIEALIEPESDGDPVNNRGAAATFVRGKGRVLVATQNPDGPLARAVAACTDFLTDVGAPSRVPVDAASWVPYDCVVLEDMPAWALTDVQKRMLRAAVEDLGVGLVCVGGPRTFGPGGYGGTDLEAVLPVTSDVANRRVLPGGALVVALHSCEFAEGNTIGREVTKRAISALTAGDEMGLIEFSAADGDRWVIELSPVGSKGRHHAAVDRSDPCDAPSLDSILEKSAAALAKSQAAVKHVIVITDGDPQPPSDKLLARYRDDLKATITTVCVAPHQGWAGAVDAMKRIARETGGNAYVIEASDTSRIPQIFIKEAVTIRRPAWVEEPFVPVLRSTHRMVREFGDGFPSLGGRTVTTTRPEAETVLSAPSDDPLLATWRKGLGSATAWTSDASSRWAPEWVAWSGYAKFWAQVVRANLRAVERSNARTSIELDGGTAHVVLDVLRDDGSTLDGMRARGVAVGPAGESQEFRLAQTGPGRYEGTFPAADVGTHLATVTWTDPKRDDDVHQQSQAAVCVSYSAEHLAQSSNERLFAAMEGVGARILDVAALDAAAGGDAMKDPARIPWTGPVAISEDPVDLWPWLAGFAALVLVMDVAVRRVRIDWSKFRLRRTPALAQPARPAATGAARAPSSGKFDVAAAREVAPSAGPGVAPTGAPGDVPPPPPVPPGGLLEAKRRAKKKQSWEEN